MSQPTCDPPTVAAGAGIALRELQRLATSGARAVEPFSHRGVQYLAVPQLAMDHPGQPAAMTAGNSDVELIVFRWSEGAFREHQRLPVAGGEDAEFFAIGERRFLATASLRSGAGPYEMGVRSTIYELVGDRFEPFQKFDTYAAKQWTHFAIGDQHFLALAQGALLPGAQAQNRRSLILRWDGERFQFLQDVPSAWGYNWLAVKVGGEQLLAYADHAEPSLLLRWNGRLFEPFQTLDGGSGRAFCAFETAGEQWLAFANLHADTLLYRWHGTRFVQHQTLSGPGGREFEWLPGHSPAAPGRLVQVNFIHGTREAPRPVLRSFIYAWRGERLEVVNDFATSGGTDAAAFAVDGRRCLAVSNSLAADVRFRADTLIYEVLEG
jgi:EPTP domain